ncbi:Uncharacterised protein [uncultured archaeon]|nr:Uncharacterised protein [uncultured archaeon]
MNTKKGDKMVEERMFLERELSQIMEVTLRLEDELNLVVADRA